MYIYIYIYIYIHSWTKVWKVLLECIENVFQKSNNNHKKHIIQISCHSLDKDNFMFCSSFCIVVQVNSCSVFLWDRTWIVSVWFVTTVFSCSFSRLGRGKFSLSSWRIFFSSFSSEKQLGKNIKWNNDWMNSFMPHWPLYNGRVMPNKDFQVDSHSL